MFAELTFSKNEVATHSVVKRVHDWKGWMGLHLSPSHEDRMVLKFTGLGTIRVDGTKRRLHSFKLRLDDNSPHAVLFYKEHDQSGTWRSHYGGADQDRLRVLKEGKRELIGISVAGLRPKITRLTTFSICRRAVKAERRIPPPSPVFNTQSCKERS
jgi:hypothetical protein